MWKEPLHVRVVWVTLLSLKESDQTIRLPLHKIANKANLGDDKLFMDAMKVLEEPDRETTIPQPYEGRRIRKVEDGWLVLNGKHYQDLMEDLNRKARLRRAQASWRERQKIKAAKNEMQAKADGEKRIETFKKGQGEA